MDCFVSIQTGPIRKKAEIYPLLDKVAFDYVLNSNKPITEEGFNAWHREETKTLCAHASDFSSDFSIGWSAKMINVYLKTAAYVGELGRQGLRDMLHPPIDSGLWEGLEEHFKKPSDIIDNAYCVTAISHIKDYDKTYLRIIRGCKQAAQELGCRLIEVEQLWRSAETPSQN